MHLLVDHEIKRKLQGTRPIIKQGFKPPADWYAHDSPVQSASLDLHVGAIYVPGVDRDKMGGFNNPLEDLTLNAGETAVVTTAEELDFPDDLTGFGFPPTRISSRGVLMTNPGHIDAGYQGSLRFTLINMGRDQFSVRIGDSIATLLLVSLFPSPVAPYPARPRPKPKHPKQPGFSELNTLSKDFLDFQERSKAIARKEVAAAELDVKRAQARLPVITGIGAAIITGLIAYLSAQANPKWREPLSALENKVGALSAQQEVGALSLRIDSLEALIRGANTQRDSGSLRR